MTLFFRFLNSNPYFRLYSTERWRFLHRNRLEIWYQTRYISFYILFHIFTSYNELAFYLVVIEMVYFKMHMSLIHWYTAVYIFTNCTRAKCHYSADLFFKVDCNVSHAVHDVKITSYWRRCDVGCLWQDSKSVTNKQQTTYVLYQWRSSRLSCAEWCIFKWKCLNLNFE